MGAMESQLSTYEYPGYRPGAVPTRPSGHPNPQPTAPRKVPSGWAKLWASLGLGVFAYVLIVLIQLAGVLIGRIRPIDENTLMAIAEVSAGIAALLFVIALGGKNIAKPSLKGMGEAWVAASWLFFANGLFVAIEIATFAMGIEHIEIAPDWPVRTAALALLCFGVGLFEEATMRGLCLNGLLARLGRTRGGVYCAVILSSLIFGMLHFDPLIDFNDSLQVAQNIMKVVQTGMCGFLLAAIMVKTRNLWAVATIHAANDFMLLFLTSGLTDTAVTTDYVHTGEEGLAILTVYSILCVMYLPFLFIGKRLIDAGSPWRGDFYHYDETPRYATNPTGYPSPAPLYPAAAAYYPVATTLDPANASRAPRHAKPPEIPEGNPHVQGL